ncbi:60S ribosomal subunit assembly or modification protein [Malassezia yamatoensis]|uniref:60S ribosomal subunit assembly or modification protein n=1 Tax=Malassezia yamatoensis TaxID=253288 RepID=A0AAJ5YWU7_9BASI|nr:60S ribosomal subunit assembly or modification protein [Malassezia yamatoensis]
MAEGSQGVEELEHGEDLVLTNDDIDTDVTESAEAPMDEGEEEDQQGADEQMEFQDDSIAAFYSHRKSVFCVNLHPKFPQPPIAVSGGEDDRAWIWNTIDGAEIAQLGGHTDSVVAVSFSHDGEYVATGGLDGRVRVWRHHAPNFTTWEFLTNLEGPSEVVWLAWHPKGPVLVAGSSDSTLWMWQLPSGNVMNVFSGHTGSVTCGRFTPDGRKLVSGSDDGSLIIWDPRSAAVLARISDEDTKFSLEGGITSMCISPDSRLVVAGGAAGGVRVLSMANLDSAGNVSVVGILDGHQEGESVEGVEFVDLVPASTPGSFSGPTSQTSTHIVSVATDGKAITWDLTSGKPRGEAMHDAAITKLVVHPSTPLITTSCMDHMIRTLDARSMQLVGIQHGFTDGVLDVAVGIDDQITQGADSGGIGAYIDASKSKGYKLIGAGDEGVALVFRLQ